jgi:hypothetical protein
MRTRRWNNLVLIFALVSSLQLGLLGGSLLCFEGDGTIKVETAGSFGGCDDKGVVSLETTGMGIQLYSSNSCPPCLDVSFQSLTAQLLQIKAPSIPVPSSAMTAALASTLVHSESLRGSIPSSWEPSTTFTSSYHPRTTVLLI